MNDMNDEDANIIIGKRESELSSHVEISPLHQRLIFLPYCTAPLSKLARNYRYPNFGSDGQGSGSSNHQANYGGDYIGNLIVSFWNFPNLISPIIAASVLSADDYQRSQNVRQKGFLPKIQQGNSIAINKSISSVQCPIVSEIETISEDLSSNPSIISERYDYLKNPFVLFLISLIFGWIYLVIPNTDFWVYNLV